MPRARRRSSASFAASSGAPSTTRRVPCRPRRARPAAARRSAGSHRRACSCRRTGAVNETCGTPARGARALIAPDATTCRVRPCARQLTSAWSLPFTDSDVLLALRSSNSEAEASPTSPAKAAARTTRTERTRCRNVMSPGSDMKLSRVAAIAAPRGTLRPREHGDRPGAVGRRNAQSGCQLPGFRRADPRARCALAGPDQGRGRPRERRPRAARRREGGADRRGRRCHRAL